MGERRRKRSNIVRRRGRVLETNCPASSGSYPGRSNDVIEMREEFERAGIDVEGEGSGVGRGGGDPMEMRNDDESSGGGGDVSNEETEMRNDDMSS